MADAVSATLCDECDHPLSDGEHQMSRERGLAFPFAFCPKCSGGPEDGVPLCAMRTHLYYRCSCGIRWQERRA
jgi:hypothetical protein